MPDVEPGNLIIYSDKEKTYYDVAHMQECMITKYWKSVPSHDKRHRSSEHSHK